MSLDPLINKVSKFETEVPRIAAQNLDWTKVLQEVVDAMDKWYEAYDPTSYVRTESLFNGVIAGFNYEFTGKKIVVTIDPSSIPDPAHGKYTGQIIYDLDFTQGYHGSWYGDYSTPPPKIYGRQLKKLADEEMKKAADQFMASL